MLWQDGGLYSLRRRSENKFAGNESGKKEKRKIELHGGWVVLVAGWRDWRPRYRVLMKKVRWLSCLTPLGVEGEKRDAVRIIRNLFLQVSLDYPNILS
jgi:hypothetical protein